MATLKIVDKFSEEDLFVKVASDRDVQVRYETCHVSEKKVDYVRVDIFDSNFQIPNGIKNTYDLAYTIVTSKDGGWSELNDRSGLSAVIICDALGQNGDFEIKFL